MLATKVQTHEIVNLVAVKWKGSHSTNKSYFRDNKLIFLMSSHR